MIWLLLLLVQPCQQNSDKVLCFQCSDFPVEPDDQDEPVGPCPGDRVWQYLLVYHVMLSLRDVFICIFPQYNFYLSFSSVVFVFILRLSSVVICLSLGVILVVFNFSLIEGVFSSSFSLSYIWGLVCQWVLFQDLLSYVLCSIGVFWICILSSIWGNLQLHIDFHLGMSKFDYCCSLEVVIRS